MARLGFTQNERRKLWLDRVLHVIRLKVENSICVSFMYDESLARSANYMNDAQASCAYLNRLGIQYCEITDGRVNIQNTHAQNLFGGRG